MRISTALLAFLLILNLNCKKEDKIDSDTINSKEPATIVFDKIISYPNDSIWVIFHIDFNPNKSQYQIEWISPEFFNDDTIYSLSFSSDLNLEFIIKDTIGNKLKEIVYPLHFNSLYNDPKFDFRNVYEGNYSFIVHQTDRNVFGGSGTKITFESTDTVKGFVKKIGEIQNSLLEIHYGTKILEQGYTYIFTEYSAWKILNDNSLQCLPEVYSRSFVNGKFNGTESLELYIRTGGLGSWSERTIIGTKIYNR
jgi:hypothetical protein